MSHIAKAMKRAALEALCNCAKSRGGHSLHCPTITAAPNIMAALQAAADAGKEVRHAGQDEDH